MKNHGCHPSATPRRARWCGTSPTPSRSTASRFTCRARTWSPAVPDPRRQDEVLAPAHLYKSMQEKGEGHLEGLPAGDDLRPSGRIRGRRRDAFQPLAGRAAAGDVRRGESEGRQRRGHPQRRLRLGRVARRRRSRCRRRSPSAWRPGTVFMPFHFSGWWQGRTCSSSTRGCGPIVRGEAVNTATTYGYDSVTMMQETKTTLCRVSKAKKDEERTRWDA